MDKYTLEVIVELLEQYLETDYVQYISAHTQKMIIISTIAKVKTEIKKHDTH